MKKYTINNKEIELLGVSLNQSGDSETFTNKINEIITALGTEVISKVEDDGLGWLPEDEEVYWYNYYTDNYRRKSAGIYRTKEEAIEVAERMLKVGRG